VAPLLPKLRGHFAEFLNHSSPDRLGILYLTTCVGLGYGPHGHSLEAFLGSMGSLYFASFGYASRLTLICGADLPTPRATRLHQTPTAGGATLLRHPIVWLLPAQVPRSTTNNPKVISSFGWLVSPASPWAHPHGYGNINPLSIDYACRPRLRSRLTLGGLTWPRNPWSSGGRVSHSAFATHACILTPTPSTARSLCRFPGCRTLPYPSTPLHNTPKGEADVTCE
jgi:hypothetical protein